MDLEHPEINTTELAAEVRKSLARQVLKRRPSGAEPANPESTRHFDQDSAPVTPTATESDFAPPSLHLNGLPKPPYLDEQPVFEPNADGQYQLKDLLRFDDATFLNAAYRAVLKREPDSSGYKHYLNQLREGCLDKVDLLVILRSSPEGKLRNVKIKGLALPALMRRLGRLQLIGYPIQWGSDLLRLPSLFQRSRQQEAQALQLNRRIVEYTQELAEYASNIAAHANKLTDERNSLVKQVSELEQQIGSLKDSLRALTTDSAAAFADLSNQSRSHTGRHEQIERELELFAERQRKSLAVLRRELKEQLNEEAASNRQQTARLLDQQQSVFESAHAENRERMDKFESSTARQVSEFQSVTGARLEQLESSTAERIKRLESSAHALVNDLESSTRAWIAHLETSARAWTAKLESDMAARIAALESSTRGIRGRVDSASSGVPVMISSRATASGEARAGADTLAARTDFAQGEIDKLRQQVQHARTELALQGSRMAVLLEAARTTASSFDQQNQAALAQEAEHKLDALYAELEDNFRGSQEEIKERFRTYLPLVRSIDIAGDLPILDLGCGRGEWLELLKDEGYEASGIDTNRVLIERCRALGLRVIESDALRYLRSQPDQSLRAITGFHIIEHLHIEVLMSLLDEIVRVLHPGGMVIFETPNPDNVLVGSNFFYFDPTHRNPLPSLLMKFLLESRGLNQIEIMNLHAWGQARVSEKDEMSARFNELFYGPMDYAIAGRKGFK
jgi:SAM-dependent methyltransferase